MSFSGLLEDFGTITQGRMLEMSDVSLEEEKLAAFEKGYQAGWDDSNNARQVTQDSNTTELITALQQMSFNLKENQSDLLFQLKPLLDQIVETLLPEIAHKSLAPKINEIIHGFLETHGRQPVDIRGSTAQVGQLQSIANEHRDLPIAIIEDAGLAAGQIQVKLGTISEQELDFKSIVDGVSHMIDSFFEAHAFETKERDVA